MLNLRRKLGSNPRRLAIAGWIAAALLLLAVAGYALPELFAVPKAAESRELATARRKLRELGDTTAVAASPGPPADTLDRLLASAAPPAAAGPGGSAAASAAAAAEGVPGESLLPELSGVMKVASVRGDIRYRALFAGRDLGVGERVDGYTIERISEAGVVLGKDGQRWTLPSPEVIYSLSQE
jgi:hypothetical protein